MSALCNILIGWKKYFLLAFFIMNLVSFQSIWSYPSLSKECLNLETLEKIGEFLCLETDPLLGASLVKEFYNYSEFHLSEDIKLQLNQSFTIEDMRRHFNTLASILSKYSESFQLSSKYFTAARFRDSNFLPHIPAGSILNLREVRLLGRYTPLYLTLQPNKSVFHEELSLYGIVHPGALYNESNNSLERSLPQSIEANGLEGISIFGKSVEFEGEAALEFPKNLGQLSQAV